MVLHPVKAFANLQNLYTAVAKNKFMLNKTISAANKYADKAKQFYINDSLISLQYNQLNNGKWNHMMDQTHIGYTYWQQPDQQKMPEVKYVHRTMQMNKIPGELLDTKSAKDLIPKNAKGNIFYELRWLCFHRSFTLYKSIFIQIILNGK